jgi:hypothetical protein
MPHAGEPRRVGPPPAQQPPRRASPRFALGLGEPRAPHGCSLTQNPLKSQPGWPILATSGRAPPRSLVSGEPCRRPEHPLDLNRPIQKQRWRLDLNPTLSEPSDPDPSAQIQSYRFGLAILLKSPWTFRELTRGPLQFKSNCSPALFLSHSPLSFLIFEPAVQPLSFCELDPRTTL